MLGGDALAGEVAMVLEAADLHLGIVDAVFSLAFATQELHYVYLQPVSDCRLAIDIADCFC